MAREIKDELQAEAPPTQPTTQAPVDTSIQIEIDEAIQDALVEVVLADYDSAREHRNKMDYGTDSKGANLTFDLWLEKLKKIYSGYREAKTVPWKFCSNRSLRIATAILEMIHARLFPAVWNESLIRFRPGETTDTPKVERIEKFMYWWNMVWAPLRTYIDGWSKYTCGFGDSLTEGSWAVETYDSGKTEKIPMSDEMGQPLINQDGTPAITEERVMNRVEKTRCKMYPRENFLFLEGSSDIQQDPVLIEEEILFKDLEAMERKGQALNVTEKLALHIIVPEPSGVVDEIQRAKLKRIRMRNVPVKIVRWYGHYDIEGGGVDESVRVIVSKDFRIYLGGVRMREITYSGKRPLEYSKYSDHADNPFAMNGQGILEMVRELAEEVDACFNQMTDGNTMSVMRAGFFDPSGDLDVDAIELAPNKMIPVTNPSQNVYFPPFEINTDRLINAIRLVLEFIERLTAASSYVMGRESEIVGGSGTATRTQAIVQSADIRFQQPAERMKHSAANILTLILDLIQRNLPPGMEMRVLGEKGEPLFGANELTMDGISGKFDCYMANDASMGSKQTEREMASMLYSILLQNIIVGTDPVKIYKITADLLRSYGKDPLEYLGPAPDVDLIDSPEDENTLMVQGDFDRVKPNIAENHILHIQKHMELLSSPTLQMLGQTAPTLVQQVVAYATQHISEHQMMLQAMTKLISSMGGGGGAMNGKGGSNGKTDSSGKPAGNGASGGATNPGGGMENTAGPLGKALGQQQKGSVAKTP